MFVWNCGEKAINLYAFRTLLKHTENQPLCDDYSNEEFYPTDVPKKADSHKRCKLLTERRLHKNVPDIVQRFYSKLTLGSYILISAVLKEHCMREIHRPALDCRLSKSPMQLFLRQQL